MFSPMFLLKKSILSMKYNTPELKKLPDYKLKFLNLQKEYGVIDEYTYDVDSIKVLYENKSKEELDCALIENDLKHEKIDKLEYTKRIYDAKGNLYSP